MRSRPTDSPGALSVLLLCDDRPSHAPNVLEHIGALRKLSRNRVELVNPRGIDRSRFLHLDDYDVVVVHYTVPLYLSEWFRDQIAAFGGLKVEFIQDEYRRVDAMTAQMRELGIHLLFSCVPSDAVPAVYGSRLPGVDILPTLTGYVPAGLERRPRPQLAKRPLDVVYRGRSVPFWLGRLAQDKVVIGKGFLARAAETGLRCDISSTEADRIYGEAWYRFLASSRTTLGTESGASIVDFDGSLQVRTEAYLRERPAATFDEVERELLAPLEGNAVIDAISPRVFEAAALGTAMVNFPGRYSGAIEAWTHYVPLQKDFSNFDEVVEAIRDEAVLERIAAQAHGDLVASGRYSLETFVRDFDTALEARTQPAGRRRRRRSVMGLNRRLRELDSLRSRARVKESSLVTSLRARSLDRVSARLVHRFPEIEAVTRNKGVAQRDRLGHDLVLLAAAAAAHVRELRHLGPPFDVRVELDVAAGRLVLVGVQDSPQDSAELDRLRDELVGTIREGRLEEIVWNNSAVRGAFAFLALPIAWLEVGYHVVGGAHRFTALEELARKDPAAAIAAFEPFFRPRPAEPVHELDRRTAVLAELVSRPGKTAARVVATARAPLATKELLALLSAYLSSGAARAEAPVSQLIRDFLRLRLLSESPATIELDADGKRLVYRTEPSMNGSLNGDELDTATVERLEQIVWDHSAVGPLVTSRSRPRVTIALDGNGAYEFRALTAVARRFPAVAVPALRRAAGTMAAAHDPQQSERSRP